MKPHIITISNQKGGVGKTTTAVSLAHGLALKGKEVLLIDLDPQGQCATTLGLTPEPGAFYLLTMGTETHETTFLKQYVRNTGREHLWLIAGNQTTMAAQTVLNSQNKPYSVIRESIARFTRGNLNYIIFDTAPSVGGIQERAVWAADMVIIPTSTEYLSTDSVRKMTEMLIMLQQSKGWHGSLLGVLPTFYSDQLREHRAAMEDLRQGFGDRVLTPIHRAAVLGECPGESKTIFEKDPESRAAQEYQDLVQRVLKHS
ncbi:MAG TPA: ParA family protein [Anaerolineaceae bacterium]|nr:ParA family protein [Anaerolineaceae bacterium]HPN52145.1 ParA family protein [Anaerolineaceae bacterium]